MDISTHNQSKSNFCMITIIFYSKSICDKIKAEAKQFGILWYWIALVSCSAEPMGM